MWCSSSVLRHLLPCNILNFSDDEILTYFLFFFFYVLNQKVIFFICIDTSYNISRYKYLWIRGFVSRILHWLRDWSSMVIWKCKVIFSLFLFFFLVLCGGEPNRMLKFNRLKSWALKFVDGQLKLRCYAGNDCRHCLPLMSMRNVLRANVAGKILRNWNLMNEMQSESRRRKERRKWNLSPAVDWSEESQN